MPNRAHANSAAFVLVASLAFAAPAAADILILRDERLVVGQVREVDNRYLLMATRDAQSKPVVYQREEVARWLTGADERSAIDSIESAASLQRLGEDYHTAGLDTLAARCLTLAAKRDPSIANQPRAQGAIDLRDFWNRTLLLLRREQSDSRDADAQLDLARWARDAGLSRESIQLLQRARQIAPDRRDITELAQKWEIDLRPLAEVDLRPAIDEPLVVQQLLDETVIVLPKEGDRLVLIPFRYRTDTSHELRRANFDIRAVPPAPVKFLGFRAMVWVDGKVSFSRRPNDPIYERLEISREDDSSRASLRGINQTHPARSPADKEANRLPPTKNRLACTGWAAAIVEVPNSVEVLNMTIGRGTPEEIRLTLLDHALKAREGPRDPDTPGVARWIRQVADGSPAMISLALHCLSAIRAEVDATRYAAFSLAVDRPILDAIERTDGEAQHEAWHCLVDSGPLPTETANVIKTAKPVLQDRLLRFAANELSQSHPGRFARPNAVLVLSAILQSPDPAVCTSAVEFLATGAPESAFDALIHASKTARAAAIARCRMISSPEIRQQIVRALAVNASPEDADTLSQLIKQDRVLVSEADDKILTRIRDTKDPAIRENLLTMLQGLSLIPVLRTPIVLQIFDEISNKDAPESLRARAALLAADQARFRTSAARGGSFPVDLAPDNGDPVIRVLCRAVEFGPASVRVPAVLALLREGHVKLAEASLKRALDSNRARVEFIDALCADPEAARVDGVLALLARLACDVGASPRRYLEQLQSLSKRREPRETPRVDLAIKSGLTWEALADYCGYEDPAVAKLATDWTTRLGHFSQQDRRQFVAPTHDRNTRIDRLRSANARLGRIALGRYELVVVLELVWPVPAGATQATTRWLPPQRITISGGEVEVRTNDIGREFQVYLGEKLRGFGKVPVSAPGLPTPDDWAMSLVPATDIAVLSGPQNPANAPGPYILASGELELSTKPGTIKLDVTDILRDAISTDPATAAFAAHANRIVPSNLSISLRYTSFGSYVGVAARRTIGMPPADAAPDSPPTLLNFAVMLERRDVQTPTAGSGPQQADAALTPQSPPSNPQ